MKPMSSLLLCATVLMLACSPSDVSVQAPPSEMLLKPSSNIPPTNKEVLQYLMRNLGVPLSVHSSCEGVGTSADDLTIGDYLSGFLAEYANPGGENWLEISADPATTASGEAVWASKVMIRRKDAEDIFGWGVGFQMSSADRSVVPDSFRCVGGG